MTYQMKQEVLRSLQAKADKYNQQISEIDQSAKDFREKLETIKKELRLVYATIADVELEPASDMNVRWVTH